MIKNANRASAYCSALILFIVGEVLHYSFYVDFPLGKLLYSVLLISSCLFAVVKLLIDFFDHHISKRLLLFMAVPAICCVYLIYTGKTGVFMFLLLFSAAGHNVSWEKITKIFAVTLISAVLFVLLSNFLGIIGETACGRGDSGILVMRYSCGFDYYYTASHYVFFCVLLWLYFRREKMTAFEWAALLLLVFYVHGRAGTRMPFYLSLCSLAVFAVVKFIPFLQEYHKAYGFFAMFVYPVCALAILLISVSLDPASGLWIELNKMMTERLALNLTGYQNYGITLLGNNIVWSTGEGYNLVDSSYLMYLYEYGVVFLAAALGVCVLLGYYCHKRKDAYYAILTCFVAVYAMFDNWWMRPECNLFLMAYPYIASVWKGKNGINID